MIFINKGNHSFMEVILLLMITGDDDDHNYDCTYVYMFNSIICGYGGGGIL